MDFVILIVVVSLLICWMYRNEEYGLSIIPFVLAIGTLIVYMVFFRPRDDYFKVWALAYGAITVFSIAFCVEACTFKSGEFLFLVSLALGLFCLITWFCTISSSVTYDYEEVDKREEIPIFSLQNDPNSGFMLGTGNIDGKLVYIYYYKDVDGGLLQDYISCNADTSKLFPVLVDGEPHIKKLWTVKQTKDTETGEIIEEVVIGGPLYYFYIPKEYELQFLGDIE